ncbi:MAG: S-methyl-5'-thioadenosine phosphorylase [Anaerolineales bacterium]|nr:S-methyl-5'-thioadenosine phosphorylase [Anaerolineales bacterium]
MTQVKIGVIGGSGLYQMDGLTDVEEVTLSTPFGSPSDNYIIGTLEGQRVAFLPRHGRQHSISPTELNSRANIWGFKSLGVKYIIAANACGSLREEYAPRHIVIPDQLFDRTRSRELTFYSGGVVVHMSVAEPFAPELAALLYEGVQKTGAAAHKGGTFVIIEGPRFSTKGESRIFRQWGCDIIGMTTIPEAFLAAEAEIAYATMAHVTDYDVWHESKEPVTVDAVIANLNANVEVAKQAIRNTVRKLTGDPDWPCHHALSTAIISHRERSAVPAETWAKLELFLSKYYEA